MNKRMLFLPEERKMTAIQLVAAGFLAFAALVFLLLSVLLLVSCGSAGDEAAGRAAPGSAIAFDTGGTVLSVSGGDSTVRGLTRTAPGTMTIDGTGSTVSLRDRGFGVFACHTGLHPYVSSTTRSNLMHNQLVSYEAAPVGWTYDPLVYWPRTDDDLSQYVTFFAYAPHSSAAGGCIADTSYPSEDGDPWIVYQLGGTEQAIDGGNGWQERQVDLLYDFRKDLRHDGSNADRVRFQFKHALACCGDRVTLTCDASLQQRLMDAYDPEVEIPVVLTLRRLTLDYVLTRKGRLVLNSSGQPNWQPVNSQDPLVHRLLTFTPGQVIARATSRTDVILTDFRAEGQGIFYIPILTGSEAQRVDIAAEWELSIAGQVAETGTVWTTTELSRSLTDASRNRDLRISLRL